MVVNQKWKKVISAEDVAYRDGGGIRTTKDEQRTGTNASGVWDRIAQRALSRLGSKREGSRLTASESRAADWNRLLTVGWLAICWIKSEGRIGG